MLKIICMDGVIVGPRREVLKLHKFVTKDNQNVVMKSDNDVT